MADTIQLTEQQLHQASGAGDSQCARILRRLMDTPDQWVSMPKLARIGAGGPTRFCMVHSRVSDMRRQGHRIDQRGSHASQYRLTQEQETAENAETNGQ